MQQLQALCVTLILSSYAIAHTYYVDSRLGKDSNSGTSVSSPFQSLDKINSFPFQPGDKILFKSGEIWRGTLLPHSGEPGNPIYYGRYGDSQKDSKFQLVSGLPLLYGSLDYSQPEQWIEVKPHVWATVKTDPSSQNYIGCDVGNIIVISLERDQLSTGECIAYPNAQCGRKKWTLDELQSRMDYYYCIDEHRVYLYSEENPAARSSQIELALRKHVINQDRCHDVIYENLGVAFGAAHGFGGSSTARITIRGCSIFYIGGGHQHDAPDGRHVRFGNGIEFWNNAQDHLIENNTIWEIYDAALTNQGAADGDRGQKSIQRNIVYRNNHIYNAEYSFEYWNRDKSQLTENILFQGNLCYNAGCGWGHNQRPDKNGAHLMFYQNSAQTKNFVVENNTFADSTEVCLRMDSDWRTGLTLRNNKYAQSNNSPIIRWLIKTYYTEKQFDKWKQEVGLDSDSTILPPKQ